MYDLIEEKKLIDLVKYNNDNDALKKLTDMHSGILYNQCLKYSLPNKAVASHADMFSNRFEAVFKACKKHDSERSQFNTLAGCEMRWSCLRELKKLVSKDEFNCENESLVEIKDSSALHIDCYNINEYIDLLEDNLIKQVFILRYTQDLTWHVIGEKLNISHQWAQIKHNLGLKIIKNKLKQKQMV